MTATGRNGSATMMATDSNTANTANHSSSQVSFPVLLYNMILECEETFQDESPISFQPCGTVFKIQEPNRFQEQVLSNWMEHIPDLDSFQFQLDLYGFHQTNNSQAEGPVSIYYHECFRRDNLNLVEGMMPLTLSPRPPPPPPRRARSFPEPSATTSGAPIRNDSAEEEERMAEDPLSSLPDEASQTRTAPSPASAPTTPLRASEPRRLFLLRPGMNTMSLESVGQPVLARLLAPAFTVMQHQGQAQQRRGGRQHHIERIYNEVRNVLNHIMRQDDDLFRDLRRPGPPVFPPVVPLNQDLWDSDGNSDEDEEA